MSDEIVSGSLILTNTEQVYCRLHALHDLVDVQIDAKNKSQAIGSIWNVYAITSGIASLVATGTLGVCTTPQNVISNIQSGAILELRGKSTRGNTPVAITGMMVGYSCPACPSAC
jgi:hypothetical protein